MKTTLRQLQGEEILNALYPLTSYSLHASPPFQNKEEWQTIVRERQGMCCQAFFEDEAPSIHCHQHTHDAKYAWHVIPGLGGVGSGNPSCGTTEGVLQAGDCKLVIYRT